MAEAQAAPAEPQQSLQALLDRPLQDTPVQQGLSLQEASIEAARRSRSEAVVQRAVEAITHLLAGIAVMLIMVLFAHDDSDTRSKLMIDTFIDHLGDHCDQPLGILLAAYWSAILLIEIVVILGVACGNICPVGCSTECWLVDALLAFLQAFVIIPVCAYWLLGPVVTLVFALFARACSAYLIDQVWTVAIVYFAMILYGILYSVWPLITACLHRYNIIDCPEDVRHFARIPFHPEKFCDDTERGYPSSCAVCLEDFAEGQDIIGTPCGNQSHAFHEVCLKGWLRVSSTCPLCRTSLSRAGWLWDVELGR
mmetsp:Transcript_81529/g.243019  ORF Transcript_81529/g.243019 Transcript_81529/m.243019 type:complete len:310 (-) Transcript_81529:67-996(-)